MGFSVQGLGLMGCRDLVSRMGVCKYIYIHNDMVSFQ